MLPQLATYGGTPTPRNESAASVSTAAAKTKLPWTMTGERQLGRTWRARSPASDTPRARAASTYEVSRITSTEPRTTRATRGEYTTAMDAITLMTLGPSAAMSAMARTMAGNAMSPSITRMTTLSVPNQCTRLGAASRPATSMWAGLPPMTGASSPTASIAAMMTTPISVVLRRVSSASQRGYADRGASSACGRAITLICRAQRGRDAPSVSSPVRALSRHRRSRLGSLVLHSRVEHQVREVDGQVDQHVDAGDAQHHALDDRVVATQDGRDDQAPEPGDVEHGLHHHRPRDQDRERD